MLGTADIASNGAVLGSGLGGLSGVAAVDDAVSRLGAGGGGRVGSCADDDDADDDADAAADDCSESDACSSESTEALKLSACVAAER